MVRLAAEPDENVPRKSAAERRQRLLQDFRVESIQRAALEVIAANGIAGATMQQIADAAGISKGTLYLYFKNREAVVESAVDRAIARLMDALAEVFASEAPLAEVLPTLLERHFEFLDEHQELFRVYRALAGEAAAENHRRTNAQHHDYLARLRELFDRAVARGEIVAVDTDRLVTFFTEGLRGLLLRRILTDAAPPPARRDVELVDRVLLHGLLRERKPP